MGVAARVGAGGQGACRLRAGAISGVDVAEKEIIVEITPTDRIRRRHVTERGKVIRFVAQYEALIDQEWVAIVRYDTVHGFVRRDVMHPGQRPDKTHLHLRDFGEAYTFAIHDLKAN